MLSVGVDLAEIPRIRHALERWGERFIQRIYTPAEVAHCRGQVPELAARFAAKEAIAKALGTGLVGVSWVEMEVLADHHGKPEVTLHGKALERARALGLSEWAISLTHTDSVVAAFVVAMGTTAVRRDV